MNVIVCVKQVPNSEKLKINRDTNTINRENCDLMINPFDMYALEEGLRIKEKYQEGKVITLSMGISGAEAMLKETIGLGADEAILLNDKAFAGSDTLATAYTLEKAIKKIGEYDLIICGKQAIDGDTAQVGPSLSERLGIPQITNVSEILEINNKKIRCKRMTDYGYTIYEAELPALITVVKDINEPRMMNLKGMIKSKSAQITVWNAKDIEADENQCGVIGSPTRVINVEVPNLTVQGEMIFGDTEIQAQKLADILLKYR